MIAAIRIKGRVEIPKEIKDTLYLLRLRKKFVCSLYPEEKQIINMLEKVKAYIAYGKINDKTLEILIRERGRKLGDKRLSEEEVKRVIEELKKGKKLKEINIIKPFFRLAPPRGGFKKNSKLLWPKGIRGNIGEKINDLILSMI
ncbi:MAG: 50S ribosomal protein L30 [Candidatus Pacearchaeota archaeon]